jgi:hypothetical protein
LLRKTLRKKAEETRVSSAFIYNAFCYAKSYLHVCQRQTLHAAKPCFTRGARFIAAKPQLHLKKSGFRRFFY